MCNRLCNVWENVQQAKTQPISFETCSTIPFNELAMPTTRSRKAASGSFLCTKPVEPKSLVVWSFEPPRAHECHALSIKRLCGGSSMVQHSAVNRNVGRSNPPRGAHSFIIQ